MKKAQLSLEFMLIFAVALMIFVLLLALLTRFFSNNANDIKKQKLDVIANQIQKTIYAVSFTSADVKIKQELPATAEGIPYTVTIQDGTLLVQNSADNIVASRPIPQVSGSFVAGECNLIEKNSAGIKSTPGAC